MGLLNQVGRLGKKPEGNKVLKKGKIDIFENEINKILNVGENTKLQKKGVKDREELELLSSGKKGYGVKLRGFINNGKITEEEVKKLKNLGLTERLIVKDINAYKILLNLITWNIISKPEIEWLVDASNGDFKRIKAYLKQIIDLDRINPENKRIIIKEFLKIEI